MPSITIDLSDWLMRPVVLWGREVDTLKLHLPHLRELRQESTQCKIISFLKAIPRHIKVLDLQGAFPPSLPKYPMGWFLGAIPSHVKTLDLRYNHIYSEDVKSVPAGVKTVFLGGEDYLARRMLNIGKIIENLPSQVREVELWGFSPPTKKMDTRPGLLVMFDGKVPYSAVDNQFAFFMAPHSQNKQTLFSASCC